MIKQEQAAWLAVGIVKVATEAKEEVFVEPESIITAAKKAELVFVGLYTVVVVVELRTACFQAAITVALLSFAVVGNEALVMASTKTIIVSKVVAAIDTAAAEVRPGLSMLKVLEAVGLLQVNTTLI